MNKELLKDIRLFKGMTQEDFAKWLGISRMTIALIESDQRNVSDAVAGKLSHKFDVTNDDFLEYRKRRANTNNYFFNS